MYNNRPAHNRMSIAIGQRFASMVIVRELPTVDGLRIVECQCDCGTTKIVSLSHLLSGHTQSCGCLKGAILSQKLKRVIGERFGRLTILKELATPTHTDRMVECICDCGTKKLIALRALRTGNTVSCGCVRDEQVAKVNFKHGLASHSIKREKTKHPLYLVWRGIKVRCYNPNCRAFKRYGGRGIRIATEWKDDPEAFVSWCLSRGWTSELTVDRIDPDRHYEPDNIQFLSKAEHFKKTRHDVRLRKRASYILGALSLPI